MPVEKSGSTYNNSIRRWFHLISISLAGLIYGFSSLTWLSVLPTLCIVTSIVLAFDLLRLHVNHLNWMIQETFGFVLRKHEFHTLSGTTWFLLGAMMNIALFPKTIAAMGFLYLAVGDPLASYVGIKYGSRPLGQKTWVGSIAFVFATWLVGWMWLLQLAPWNIAFWASGAAGVAAALGERGLHEIDDNLVIPIITSLVCVIVLAIL